MNNTNLKGKDTTQISCFNSKVVIMVAWFTVVVEAYMYMTTISLLFPHSGKRERGLRKQGNYIQLAPHTNVSNAARVTNLFLVTCNKL